MSKKDHYAVLGVARTASPEEIRKAYRALVRQYHPDVNKSAGAEARFKEVQEAYDTLSDEKARERYDRFGHTPPGAAQPGRGAHYTWTNVGGGARGSAEFDLDDLGSMFDAFFGSRSAEPGRRPGRARGPEAAHEIEIPFETAVRGGTRTVKVEHAGRESRVEVPIPAGVADGARLRVRGGGPRGADLTLTVRIRPHAVYRRDPSAPDSLDLYLDLPLTLAEAVMGGRVAVPTFSEGQIELTIPPGTSSGRKLRLKGQGIRDAQGRVGDLYAVTRVVVPDAHEMSAADREALMRLSSRGPAVRTGPGWND